MTPNIRRVQSTGGGSLTVTLPKDWADKVGLKIKDSVSIQEQPNGSLILCPLAKAI